MDILFTNRKLPTIQSESVSRSSSKASTYSCVEKIQNFRLSNTERSCRQQVNCGINREFVIKSG